MKIFIASLSVLICIVSLASAQTWRSPRHGKSSTPETTRAKKISRDSASTVGLGFKSITPDLNGGVWINGTAWLFRGLLVNDRNGKTNAITTPGVVTVSKLQFVTRDIGWMTDGRSLYRTLDGGNSWQRVKLPDQPGIRSLYFSDLRNGWTGGWDGEIYHTTDAGQTWKKQQTRVEYEIQQILFVDAIHGWAIGFKCYPNLKRMQALLRTNDGGDTWETLSNEDIESARSLDSVVFVTTTDGWAIDGQYNNIVHTIDGGKTWTVQQPGEGHSWNSLFFINGHEGWASGDGVLHTSDGGETWDYQLNRDRGEDYLEAITFTDNKHGWAIGVNSALRTTDGGTTWTRMPDDWKEMIPSFQILLKENSLKIATKQR